MPRGLRLSKKKPNGTLEGPVAGAYIAMAEDELLQTELAGTPTSDNIRRVGERIRAIWDREMAIPPHPEIVSNFFSWAGQSTVSDALPLLFHQALKRRRSETSRFHRQKLRIVNLSNLNPKTVNKYQHLSQIPLHKCHRLAVAFPPPQLYIAETREIYDRNMAFVLERDLPDTRIPQKYMFELDRPSTWELSPEAHSLRHDLGPGESARFEDENGDLVAFVMRGACRDRRVVQFMDSAVEQTVLTRRNARKEDRGHISQMGLSAGSRSSPKVGWVRNIERQKNNKELHDKVNYDASSAFAVLWSLARALLPDIILSDFAAFIETLGPDLRMDGNGTMKVSAAGKGTYHINVGDVDFKFQNAELAPPCGVMAENYCRYIHFENQPHTWAVSLTTSRSFDPHISSLDAGGHFYISAYGIRVQAAPNTLIAWRPKDWHGTSLFHISPGAQSLDEHYYQRGLCIVTGSRVVNAIKNWRTGRGGEEELDDIEKGSVDEHSYTNELDTFVEELRMAPLRRSHRLAEKPKRSYLGC